MSRAKGNERGRSERWQMMRRPLLVVCLLAVLVPAGGARAEEITVGSIDAAVAHPALPRALYLESEKLNGIAGYVVPLAPGASRFELARVAGATGRDDPDAWFYRDIRGTGDPCPRDVESQSPSLETGSICEGATFAVVVLFTGADAIFQLKVS